MIVDICEFFELQIVAAERQRSKDVKGLPRHFNV